MPRVLIPPSAVQNDRIVIGELKTVHHLVSVLRIKSGDDLECLDGRGGRYHGQVLEAGRGRVVMQISRREQEPPASTPVDIGAALIRPERFEWMIEKVSELGAASLTPLLTARTVSRWPARQAAKLERWRRLAVQAAEQCGRATVTTVESIQGLPEYLASRREALCLVPTLAAPTRPFHDVLDDLGRARRIAIVIGPEGDFTPEEAQTASAQGAKLISLGRLTLRAETAAVAALAAVQHRLGAW